MTGAMVDAEELVDVFTSWNYLVEVAMAHDHTRNQLLDALLATGHALKAVSELIRNRLPLQHQQDSSSEDEDENSEPSTVYVDQLRAT